MIKLYKFITIYYKHDVWLIDAEYSNSKDIAQCKNISDFETVGI